jgi:deazaflavin-dependent oxidoreductase (nitroreductase family)
MTTRFWKTVNPGVRPLAGIAPWWVLLETTGSRTGQSRRTPLAGSPFDGETLRVLSVYGEQAAFVKNIRVRPAVRVKRRGTWMNGDAVVVDPTPATVACLGWYARRVLLRIGTDPKIIEITVTPASRAPS